MRGGGHTEGQSLRRRSSGHGLTRGLRGPIDPIRPPTQSRVTQTRRKPLLPLQLHPILHFPVPHPTNITPLAMPATSTNSGLVLDHPHSRSWGRVVKHRTPHAHLQVAGLKPHSQAKHMVRDRAAGCRNPGTGRDALATRPRHPNDGPYPARPSVPGCKSCRFWPVELGFICGAIETRGSSCPVACPDRC